MAKFSVSYLSGEKQCTVRVSYKVNRATYEATDVWHEMIKLLLLTTSLGYKLILPTFRLHVVVSDVERTELCEI